MSLDRFEELNLERPTAGDSIEQEKAHCTYHHAVPERRGSA